MFEQLTYINNIDSEEECSVDWGDNTSDNSSSMPPGKPENIPGTNVAPTDNYLRLRATGRSTVQCHDSRQPLRSLESLESFGLPSFAPRKLDVKPPAASAPAGSENLEVAPPPRPVAGKWESLPPAPQIESTPKDSPLIPGQIEVERRGAIIPSVVRDSGTPALRFPGTASGDTIRCHKPPRMEPMDFNELRELIKKEKQK